MSADCFVSAVIYYCSFSLKTKHLGPIYLPKNAITHCHLVLMAQTARNLKSGYYIFQVWPYPENLGIPSTDRGSCRCTAVQKTWRVYSKDLTLGATTISETTVVFFLLFLLWLCSYVLSLFHSRLGPGAELLLQQPPPFSVLPGKDLKSQSWDRAVGWERILPTEHLWQF